MSSFTPALLDALRPAVEAGRRALAKLDEAEVPSRLRRVAAHSGGRLPPPLARRLLEVLDTEEWLRDAAAEELRGGESAVAEAFLRRPPGWWATMVTAAVARATAEIERARNAADRRAEAAEARFAEARRRLEAATASASVRKETGSGDGERRLRARVAAQRQRAREAERERDAARDVAARREADLAEVERLARRWRDRWREQRKSDRTSPSGAAFAPRDPEELARLLDRLAVTTGSALAPTPAPSTSPPRTAPLPPGVAPDDAAAMEALLGREIPFTLLVDGYNVLYLLDPGAWSTGSARRRLEEELRRFRRLARSTPRVAVVYDSAVPGPRDTLPGRDVEVRFAPEGTIADEAIVELAAAARGDVYVISTDRAVRDQAEAVGAVALWAEALVAWIRS